MDYSCLVNKEVYSKLNGKGKILSLTGNRIVVRFYESNKEMGYTVPLALDHTLIVEDKGIEAQIKRSIENEVIDSCFETQLDDTELSYIPKEHREERFIKHLLNYPDIKKRWDDTLSNVYNKYRYETIDGKTKEEYNRLVCSAWDSFVSTEKDSLIRKRIPEIKPKYENIYALYKSDLERYLDNYKAYYEQYYAKREEFFVNTIEDNYLYCDKVNNYDYNIMVDREKTFLFNYLRNMNIDSKCKLLENLLTYYANKNDERYKYQFEGLVHITEYRNVKRILHDGYLIPRNQLRNQGIAFEDRANQDVINNTYDWIKDCNRFYYGFNTPTHYRAEYRMPIGLVFSSELFKSPDAIFCSESAARKAMEPTKYISEALLYNWKEIMERGPFDRNAPDADQKVAYRNADFLIEGLVPISKIAKIYCPIENVKIALQEEFKEQLKNIEIIVDRMRFI